MTFAPQYVLSVLRENFEDAKTWFLVPLMRIHYAHLVMLAECAIVSVEDARRIRTGLDAIDEAAVRRTTYDGSCEDLFFYLDRLLVAACGEEVAGRLHTARSRNDIDMAMYRMQQRTLVLAVIDGVLEMRQGLIEVATAHREAVFPAHTHTQPAQPSTIAHYLLAVIEQLERDVARLRAAFASINRNPLGACAITGTGFPIDRMRTTALVGFDVPTGNTYGSIATVDYMLEGVTATAILLTGLGRVLQDLLLWCTSEVGYLRLSDGFVQCSSIMPQKRNPVALEHARSIASKALGQAGAIATVVHNTPFGDIVDTEDDLQPLVFTMYKDAIRAIGLVTATMATATFDCARMAERAEQGWITVTELADTLTRDHGVPFRTSHEITTRFIAAWSRDQAAPLERLLAEAAREVSGRAIEYEAGALTQILSPRHFVEVRTTPGGPAPLETARALEAANASLAADRRWLTEVRDTLAAAADGLRVAVAAL